MSTNGLLGAVTVLYLKQLVKGKAKLSLLPVAGDPVLSSAHSYFTGSSYSNFTLCLLYWRTSSLKEEAMSYRLLIPTRILQLGKCSIMFLECRLLDLEPEAPGVKLPEFYLGKIFESLWTLVFLSVKWVEVGAIIIGLPCFLRLLWRSRELEQQDAEWMSGYSISECDSVELRHLWRHKGAPAPVSLHLCHNDAPHGFLNPATASHSIQLPFLVFLSSALSGPHFPADPQKNIGGEGCLRGTKVRGNPLQSAQFAEVAWAVVFVSGSEVVLI